MRCSWENINLILNGEPFKTLSEPQKYLGSQVAADGGCESDVVHRLNEGCKAWAALKVC